MTTAFVLSGGGSLGAVQVGMLAALAEAGVTPDLVVGTSVGAVNAAWMAGHGAGPEAVEHLRGAWLATRRQDVFPIRPLRGLLGFLGRTDHLVPLDGLAALLRRHTSIERFEEAALPVTVIATEVLTGLEVPLCEGDLTEAVAASAAIPGVFPPVEVGGRLLMDGGVADNTPISHAVAMGADVVWVLPTGYACDLAAPPRSALAMLVHAITLLIQERMILDVVAYEPRVDLRILPPLCPLDVSPVDFSRTAELIGRAHRSSRDWLEAAPPTRGQDRYLSLHRHPPPKEDRD